MASSTSFQWTIRPATREDVPSIIFLAKALAEYLFGPRTMTTGEKEMLRDGFGERPWFHVLVAELTSDDGPVLNSTPVDPEKPSSSTPHNDRIVGYAVYYYTYSMLQGRSLFLEDLCVKEEYRNCGIGTAVMQECAKLARKEGCTNMTWQLMDWNTKAKQFYERIGGDIKKGWLTMKLAEPGLGNLASGDNSTNKSA